MKRVVIILSAVGILGTALAAQTHEQHKHVKGGSSTSPVKAVPVATKAKVPTATVTKVDLTGELIDPQCWFTHNGEGRAHAKCAVTCAKGGQDLAFLDARTNEMHTLIAAGHGNNPNDGLYEHVGVPVRVRGTLYQRGTSSGLLVEAVEHAR